MFDEVGMVGFVIWGFVQDFVDCMGGKFILVGDGEQFQLVLDLLIMLQVVFYFVVDYFV